MPLPLQEPASAGAMPPGGGSALWALGFRPFYLLAGAFAAVSVAVWTAEFAGAFGSHSWLRNPLWHAHEMIFGYAFAVVTGFLFTAARNWTQRPTPTGVPLAAIAALWLAARLLVMFDQPLLAAGADTAFALAVAIGLALPLTASGNRRNYFFVALMLGLGAANLAFHLAMAGVIDLPLRLGLQAGLDLLLFIIAVMAGRVVPMFTNNGVRGAGASRHPRVEQAAQGGVLLLLAVDVLGAPAAVIAAIAALTAIAHAARLALWRPWRTLRVPILWILHISYAWVVMYLLLRALAEIDLVQAGVATHALTVGAIGGLTLGMMTRTARGHTGRPLQAGGMETTAYVLVQCAALARVLPPLLTPQALPLAVHLSGTLWVLAFLIFTLTYWPILTQPRLDGQPG